MILSDLVLPAHIFNIPDRQVMHLPISQHHQLAGLVDVLHRTPQILADHVHDDLPADGVALIAIALAWVQSTAPCVVLAGKGLNQCLQQLGTVDGRTLEREGSRIRHGQLILCLMHVDPDANDRSWRRLVFD